jgi:hypothetical protein
VFSWNYCIKLPTLFRWAFLLSNVKLHENSKFRRPISPLICSVKSQTFSSKYPEKHRNQIISYTPSNESESVTKYLMKIDKVPILTYCAWNFTSSQCRLFRRAHPVKKTNEIRQNIQIRILCPRIVPFTRTDKYTFAQDLSNAGQWSPTFQSTCIASAILVVLVGFVAICNAVWVIYNEALRGQLELLGDTLRNQCTGGRLEENQVNWLETNVLKCP